MARKTTTPALPSDPQAPANYWRQRAEKLEQKNAHLRAALKRKQAVEAGKPVLVIVRARRPKQRW
jgi:hypothetical protein